MYVIQEDIRRRYIRTDWEEMFNPIKKSDAIMEIIILNPT